MDRTTRQKLEEAHATLRASRDSSRAGIDPVQALAVARALELLGQVLAPTSTRAAA